MGEGTIIIDSARPAAGQCSGALQYEQIDTFWHVYNLHMFFAWPELGLFLSLCYAKIILNRAVAQLAERARHMREVIGSTPVSPTILRDGSRSGWRAILFK